MNDPSATDDHYLDALDAEYMQLAEAGDAAALEFAVECSDEFCLADQVILQGLMKSAGPDNDDSTAAMWARCARHVMLDVLAKEVAPEWARTEAVRRRQGSIEPEWEDYWRGARLMKYEVGCAGQFVLCKTRAYDDLDEAILACEDLPGCEVIDRQTGRSLGPTCMAEIEEAKRRIAVRLRGWAVYNPEGKPVEDLPAIYGFNNGGSRDWYSAVLLAQDGTFLGSHLCSHELYMEHDLGILEGSRPDRHETFREHYPSGYRMEFVPATEVKSHCGLMEAYRLNQEKCL